MKQFILLFILAALFSVTYAQQAEQEAYTGFLTQALEAVQNGNEQEFTINMKYFSTAIEEENITPEILTPKNFELYSECLLRAMETGYFSVKNFNPDNITFLKYNIDNHPNNMILLGFIYRTGKYGISEDTDQALYWYGKALGKEDERALGELNAICSVSNIGNNEHCEEVINIIKKEAERGLPIAIKGLADYYFHKYREYDKAAQWYQKAFDTGNVYQKAQAAEKMGLIYGVHPLYNQKKSKQWDTEAVSLYEKYVENFEKHNTVENMEKYTVEDFEKSNGSKNPYYEYINSLSRLVFHYEYTLGIKSQKKAKFYKEKVCKSGIEAYCEGHTSSDIK